MKEQWDSAVPARAARTAAVFAVPGWFLLYLCVLLTTLYLVGTDPGLYYRLQMRADILPAAGISAEELRDVDEALADYLKGDCSALDDSAFNDDEKRHMADCLGLFRLLKTAMLLTGAVGLAFVSGAMIMGHRSCSAPRIAMFCLLVPVIAALIWAAVDFEGLFFQFHELLFTNDLWLMDPDRDLMNRICPESMFASMAAIVAVATVAFMLIVNVLARVVCRKDRRR